MSWTPQNQDSLSPAESINFMRCARLRAQNLLIKASLVSTLKPTVSSSFIPTVAVSANNVTPPHEFCSSAEPQPSRLQSQGSHDVRPRSADRDDDDIIVVEHILKFPMPPGYSPSATKKTKNTTSGRRRPQIPVPRRAPTPPVNRRKSYYNSQTKYSEPKRCLWPLCDKSFLSRKPCISHRLRHIEKMEIYTCSDCRVYYGKYEHYREHEVKVHNVGGGYHSVQPKQSCGFGSCKFDSTDFEHLLNHRRSHCNELDINLCHLCPAYFEDSKALKQHTTVDCVKCCRKFAHLPSTPTQKTTETRQKRKDTNKTKSTQKFSCLWPKCNHEVSTSLECQQHHYFHALEMGVSICWLCPQIFLDRKLFASHCDHHGLTNYADYVRKLGPLDIENCGYPGCTETASHLKLSDEEIHVHRFEHLKHIGVYVCSKCLHHFPAWPELKEHILVAHTTKLRIKCNYKDCNVLFDSEARLQSHLFASHKPASNTKAATAMKSIPSFGFKCCACRVGFQAKRQLLRHYLLTSCKKTVAENIFEVDENGVANILTLCA